MKQKADFFFLLFITKIKTQAKICAVNMKIKTCVASSSGFMNFVFCFEGMSCCRSSCCSWRRRKEVSTSSRAAITPSVCSVDLTTACISRSGLRQLRPSSSPATSVSSPSPSGGRKLVAHVQVLSHCGEKPNKQVTSQVIQKFHNLLHFTHSIVNYCI